MKNVRRVKEVRSDSGMFDMHYDYSRKELECIDDMKLEVVQVDAYETGRIKFHRYYLITLFSGDEVVYRSGRESNEERTWHIYDTIHNAMVMGDDLTADQMLILHNFARYTDHNFASQIPDISDVYDLHPIRDFGRKAQRYMDMVQEDLQECSSCLKIGEGEFTDEGVCPSCQDDVTCMICLTEVDERSLIMYDDCFICPNCEHSYTEEEIKEKLNLNRECTKCYRVMDMDGQPDDEGVCEDCQDDERAGIEYLGEMYQDI